MKNLQVIARQLAVTVVVLLSMTPTISAANILALFPAPSPSHLIIDLAVVRALAERNHNVTVVTVLPIRPSEINSNITHIKLNCGLPNMEKAMRESANIKGLAVLTVILSTVRTMSDAVAEILDDKIFQNFLHNKDNKFDLVLNGYVFSDFLLGVSAHFNCPTVLLWPNQLIPHLLRHIGNPYEESYVAMPVLSGMTFDGIYNFKFRLLNTVLIAMESVLMSIADNRMKQIYDKHFPGDRYPEYAVAKQNISLILFCHHFSEKPIRALVPGLVEIGGIQLNEQPNELPQDIAKFLDGANEHGAIFFSLGTNIRTEQLEPNTLKIIFNVLSKLPQKVIWKCDKISDVPGNSTNILYKIWLPQADILAHRNIRLFFTHGGKGGITEAQFHGVPMIVLPVFGDQPMNSVEVVRKGYGVEIENYRNMTEVDVQQVVHEVLTNTKYRLAVQQFSKVYRDRPMTAKQTAVYWVEYVIRHRGALHMQSPLKNLNFVQTHNLDVMLVFVAIVFVAILCIKLSFKIIRKILREVRQKKLKNN